ncbi:MAG: hypothetical protein KC877_03500 [Candidatus Kaiserbacteria bacterium]|nr:hypothetical protein [Candidatus Kaiserbacteria bacterium]MCB9816797.1 hypothetical protein [Candidatus Nomurabacteria bacterium]
MTATIDLVLLGLEHTIQPYVPRLEVKTLLLDFSDTHGMCSETMIHKRMLIDSLFGDGPKRYNLQTYTKIRLVKRRPMSPTNAHLRLREDMIATKVRQYRGNDLYALSLKEFLERVRAVPRSDYNFWTINSTLPAIAYLEALTGQNLWAIPLIGGGLHRHLEYGDPFSKTMIIPIEFIQEHQ